MDPPPKIENQERPATANQEAQTGGHQTEIQLDEKRNIPTQTQLTKKEKRKRKKKDEYFKKRVQKKNSPGLREKYIFPV